MRILYHHFFQALSLLSNIMPVLFPVTRLKIEKYVLANFSLHLFLLYKPAPFGSCTITLENLNSLVRTNEDTFSSSIKSINKIVDHGEINMLRHYDI